MTNNTQLPTRLPVREIAAAAEALITLLNTLSGDPDLEDSGDAELDGTDQGDPSWPEFHTLGRHKAVNLTRSLPNEDAEVCDPDEEDGEDQGGLEDEPQFDRAQCERLSAFYGDGPGGGSLLDSDLDGGEV